LRDDEIRQLIHVLSRFDKARSPPVDFDAPVINLYAAYRAMELMFGEERAAEAIQGIHAEEVHEDSKNIYLHAFTSAQGERSQGRPISKYVKRINAWVGAKPKRRKAIVADLVGDIFNFSLIMKKNGFKQPRVMNGEESDNFLRKGKDVVNIGILSGLRGIDILSVAREAGKRTDANVLAIPYKDSVQFSETTVHKRVTVQSGVMFREGVPYWLQFSKPIFLHYIADFGHIKNLLELGVPLSRHQELNQHKGDVARILMEEGISPDTITLKLKRKVGTWSAAHEDDEFLVNDDISLPSQVDRRLWNFLVNQGVSNPSAVAKPAEGVGGRHVEYVYRENLDEVAYPIADRLRAGDDFVVQSRIIPPLINNKLDWNVRVLISRDRQDRPVISGTYVRMLQFGKVVNISRGADVIFIDELAQELGLTKTEEKDLNEEINRVSLRAYEVLNEKMRESGEIGENEWAGDFAGIDVMVQKDGDKWRGFVIEVNDDLSGGMWDIDDRLTKLGRTEQIGASNSDWIDVMVRRARRYKEEFVSARQNILTVARQSTPDAQAIEQIEEIVATLQEFEKISLIVTLEVYIRKRFPHRRELRGLLSVFKILADSLKNQDARRKYLSQIYAYADSRRRDVIYVPDLYRNCVLGCLTAQRGSDLYKMMVRTNRKSILKTSYMP